MSLREPLPPSNACRIARACVGISVATATIAIGLVVMALRLENHPPTLMIALAFAALLGVAVPVSVLI